MSINPNNYPGANITIVGFAGGEYEVVDFPSGGQQAQLSIGVGKGYKNKQTNEWVDTGTDWYTLTAAVDWAENNWPEVSKGDKVRVDDARLEFKPYKDKQGNPRVEAKLIFGTLVVLEAKSERPARGSQNSSSDNGGGTF